ncbi:FAD-dependent oxidoreductase [Phenylobacterium sp.]|uniref:FAD-dependent oxidoreductase n=1 Tax=Phenylobacterium sp. TaxID=1871053 RepID=UPI003918F8BB
MPEKVLVIGAGMAGLWVALALAPTGREVVLLDRDPPPPEGGADEAFETWARRGVGQLRHSHAFLARLRLLIRDQHPELLAELHAAGCRDLGLEGSLTAAHRKRYRPEPIDDDLVILTSRRTTLELVIRRYVARLPGVTLRSGVFVRELLVESGPTPRVTGVRIDGGGGTEDLAGDVVVDAAGRTSQAIEQLTAAGATIPEEAESAGVIYFTRHYRLRPGAEEPPRASAAPSNGDMGYLKFGVFPGDNGWFSITLCLPEIEESLRQAVVDPAVFDAVCRLLPGPARWIEPNRAEGMSRVFGMGQLESRWRDYAPEGRAAVLGFFAVGDSLVRTNPLYGRGCSFAAVGAQGLRDALDATPDPAERLVRYSQTARSELRPYFEVMRDSDRSAIRRARLTMTPGAKPSLKGRIVKSFLDDGVAIAIREDVDILRAFLRGFHMLEHPQAWLKRPGNLAKVLAAWARPRRTKAYPPKLGPDRSEMLATLGLA